MELSSLPSLSDSPCLQVSHSAGPLTGIILLEAVALSSVCSCSVWGEKYLQSALHASWRCSCAKGGWVTCCTVICCVQWSVVLALRTRFANRPCGRCCGKVALVDVSFCFLRREVVVFISFPFGLREFVGNSRLRWLKVFEVHSFPEGRGAQSCLQRRGFPRPERARAPCKLHSWPDETGHGGWVLLHTSAMLENLVELGYSKQIVTIPWLRTPSAESFSACSCIW